MRTELYEMEVLVRGRPITEYRHQGGVFVEGHRGSEFTIRVHNHSGRNVLATVSVDGLSVMNGKTASSESGGYVVAPYGNIAIPGWRLNNAQVARFFFSNLPEAYASQMDKPNNIGVIGALIFKEREREVYRPKTSYPGFPWPPPLDEAFKEEADRYTLGGSSRSSEPTKGFSYGIGTGFGRLEEHYVTEVSFQRSDDPPARLIIRYDDAEGLSGRGIVLSGAHSSDPVLSANPFPGDSGGCKPPPGWRGEK